jgi:glycyl-tRNA synthetase alpha subunit
MYLAKDSLVKSIAILVHRISIYNKNTISIHRVIDRLLPINLLLRIKFELASYDEIRTFIAKYTARTESYMIGSNYEVILEEISRVINIALIGTAWSSVKKIPHIYDIVDNKERIESLETSTLTYNGELHPIIYAIKNNLDRLNDYITKVQPNKFNLKDAMDSSPMLDIEKVTSYERMKYANMRVNISIANNFRRELKFDANQIMAAANPLKVLREVKVLHFKFTQLIKSTVQNTNTQ